VDGRDEGGHDDEEIMTDIRVPALGESVTEATIGKWFKKPGDAVAVDEPLVELETDKVTIEVPAPAAGVLGEISAKDGDTVAVGALLGEIKDGTAPTKAAPAPSAARAAPMPAPPPQSAAPKSAAAAAVKSSDAPSDAPLAPSVRKLAAESGVDAASLAGTGKDGRVSKGDMLAAIERAAGRGHSGCGAAARPNAARRCGARGARAHDAAASNHRPPPEGRAKHRRHAHDL
jgi:2-oxoglutarate dehydrogenase E2 component (dihydrolipoamide succinyltransferase)